MMQDTPSLSLPLLQEGQAQKHVTVNEALCRLDALVQPVIVDDGRSAPPATPAEGACHVVGAAVFRNGGWDFLVPRAGWTVRRADGTGGLRFDGAAWVGDAPRGAPAFGINATADDVNRLAVAAPGTLLTHEGGDHRLTINKAAEGDTASLLFQTGWSGRAEIGTAGSGDLSVKVSADGAGWTTAMVVDGATGIAGLPAMPRFSVTSSAAWTEIATPNTDIVFDTVLSDPGGGFDSGQGGYVVPSPGLYGLLVNGFLGPTTDGRVCFGINGQSATDQMQVLNGAMPLSFLAVVELARGDLVTCRTGNVNALLRYYGRHTTFTGWKIA